LKFSYPVIFGLLCLLLFTHQVLVDSPAAQSTMANKVYLSDERSIHLSPSATFYEDPEHLLTPDIIINRPDLNGFRTDNSAPNFGHSDSAYWLSVDIENPRSNSVSRIITLKSPLTDLVSFYVISDKDILDSYTTGDKVPFNIRRIPHPNPSIEIQIDAHSIVQVLIRQVTSSPIQFDAVLMSKDDFYKEHLSSTAQSMFYYGILFLVMLFGAYTFWITKERIFASYTAYIFFRILLQSSLAGFAFQYLFPNLPSIQNLVLVLSASATMASFALFTSHLFNVKGFRSSLIKVLMLLTTTPCLIMFTDYQFALILTKAIGLLTLILLMEYACFYALKGIQIARFYLMTMCIVFVTTGYFTLSQFGWVPHSNQLHSFFQLGMMLEILLLVILISMRFEQETKQRVMAEVQAQKHSQESDLLEKQLHHRAFHHPKNLLPNDVYFHQTYQNMIATDGFSSHAIVFIKVHKLKEFDRTLGSKSSERLTQALAKHLNASLRAYPSIVAVEQSSSGPVKLAALDQSSFLFLADVESEKKISTLVRSISDRLKHPFTFESINLDLDIRIGIAFSTQPPEDIEVCSQVLDELIREAKIAANLAFEKRRLFHSYNEREDHFNEERLSLAAELRMALQNNELTLAYQPQIYLSSKVCYGLEALLRWHNSGQGMISPEEFISVAEQNGLIKPLTLWVINKALREFGHIREAQPQLQLSINISVLNLHEPGFVEAVSDALIKTQVPAENLTLEITESSLISDDLQEKRTLNELKDLGIQLSIDDFGTGYSGLSQIHNLAAHELKIDKSFIFDINQKPSAETIVKASINIAHDLGMKVVAEGIENAESENTLTQLGCDIGQGFLYARPMDMDAVRIWLTENNQKA